MAQFEKGHLRVPGAGRTKGTPNNATRNAREAIGRLVEANLDRLQGWLDEIAVEQGAHAAFRCLIDLFEYHVPKLGRTELIVDTPEDKARVLDASKMSYEDRTALRAILLRAAERECESTSQGGA